MTVYFLGASLWSLSKSRDFEIKDHLIGHFNQRTEIRNHKHILYITLLHGLYLDSVCFATCTDVLHHYFIL